MKRIPRGVREGARQKLRTILHMRERQFALAVASLKRIVQFESAHLSIFETEVHQLQRIAVQGLCDMEELQRGKKGKRRSPTSEKQRRFLAKLARYSLYGKFATPRTEEE